MHNKSDYQKQFCDAKVILRGVKLWLTSKQPTPWSNYFFTPRIAETDPNAKIFYQENPNYLQDFATIKKEHKKLEEQEANEKNN